SFEEALRSGKPEPYGKNANLIYKEMSSSFDQIFYDSRIEQCWRAKNEAGLKQRIQEILQDSVKRTNERLIGYVPPEKQKMRRRVAAVVAVAVLAIFFFLFRHVWRVFTPSDSLQRQSGWSFGRYWYAYVILIPAIGTILLWQYVPLLRGS